MCTPISHRPPECLPLRTIRRALVDCEHLDLVARVFFIAGALRTQQDADCDRVADVLQQIYIGKP